MEEKNFWQNLIDSWKTQGKDFLSGLPKFVAESGLSLGSNWLGGLIENQLDFNSYRQKAYYQYQLSEKMADNAYNRQLDFWNKQNAYNTPQAMVGRMVDAGLNPAQSISPQPAGGLSSVSTPMPSASSSRPNIAGGLDSFGQILRSVKELGLLDKETELKAKELVSKQLDNDLKALAKASGFSDAQVKEMDRRAQWESIYGDDVPVPENPYLSDLFPMSMVRNPRTQDYREGEQRIAESVSRQGLIDAQKLTENTLRDLRSTNLQNSNEEIKAKTDLARKQWEETAERIKNLSYDNAVKELKQNVNFFYGIDVSSLPPELQSKAGEYYLDCVNGKYDYASTCSAFYSQVDRYIEKNGHIVESTSYTHSDSWGTQLYKTATTITESHTK